MNHPSAAIQLAKIVRALVAAENHPGKSTVVERHQLRLQALKLAEIVETQAAPSGPTT